VTLCCTHGVLSGNAVKRIDDSLVEEIIITDTIPQRQETQNCKKIKILSISDLLGEAIRRIAVGESISTLFS
jgi:ribose-phosphate pyrophosphokinase